LPVETTLILKDGERAYFCERAELIDWDTTRKSTNPPTDNSSDVWEHLDQGMLTITNLRAVFEGRSGTRNFGFPKFLWVEYDRWKLAKMVSVSPRSDGIEVSVENRQRSSGFTCTNPLMPWMVANVCARFPDPSKWDGKTIEVDFDLIEESVREEGEWSGCREISVKVVG
jgi:hypothetical protein